MKKELIIGASVLISVGLCILMVTKRKKKEQPKEEEVSEILDTPEKLLTEIIKGELTGGEWKNERDFLGRITKKFIVGAKSMDWIDKLPISQEDLQTKLSELGFLNEYEKKLEEKYKK